MKTELLWHHRATKKPSGNPRYQLNVSDPSCEPVEHNGLMDPAPVVEEFKPRHIIGIVLLAILLVWGMVSLWQYNDRELDKVREAHPEQFEVPPE